MFLHNKLEIRARLFRLVCTLVLLVGLLLSAELGTVAKAAPQSQTGPTNWTILVGGEGLPTDTEHGPVGSWSFMRFYPDNITINVGDSITFKQKSAEIHNVLFVPQGKEYPDFIVPEGGDSKRFLLNSLVAYPQGGNSYNGTDYAGSGVFGLGPQAPKEWKVNFTKPGTYTFVCSIHASVNPQDGKPVGMIGQVTVQPAGTAYPKTQAQIDQEIQAQLDKDVKNAQAVDACHLSCYAVPVAAK